MDLLHPWIAANDEASLLPQKRVNLVGQLQANCGAELLVIPIDRQTGCAVACGQFIGHVMLQRIAQMV